MNKYQTAENNLKKAPTEKKNNTNNVVINADEETAKHIKIESGENFTNEMLFLFSKESKIDS